MKRTPFSTPILLLVFNRPDYFIQTISILRKIKPTDLYISGDGPREKNESDEKSCNAVQDAVSLIDWKCNVHTKFNKKNLGCKACVNRGISWFFQQVPEGIILEDDCQPDLSFFPYCEELLERYRHDQNVAMISGNNPFGQFASDDDYFFSIHPLCWGWASWRRAWKKYDVKMKGWPIERRSKNILNSHFASEVSKKYWSDIFDQMYNSKIDTWDYQWTFACWKHQMLCIIPTKNLIQNVGFDSRATHTKLAISPLHNQTRYSLKFPLHHPSEIKESKKIDSRIQETIFEKNKYLKLLNGFQKSVQRKLPHGDRMILQFMPQSTTIHIKPQAKWYFVDLPELWRFRELFLIFAWRDIMVRYKQTFVGVGWVVFQPLVNTVIFTIFFGNFAKIPSGSLPYPLFVLLGLIFWTFFSTSLSHAANSFIENTPIMGKVYFPREILPLSSMAVGLVDFAVSAVLFIMVALFYQVHFSLAFLLMVIIGLLITIIAGSGLGLLLASINVKYRDVRYILPYFLQMMIFITPVIYPLGIMRPSFQRIVSINPMAGVIDGLRSTLVSGQINNWEQLGFAFLSSLALLFIGIIYFRKTQAFFADLL